MRSGKILLPFLFVLMFAGCCSQDQIETEYDIFNLRWGCTQEYVEQNCDFGGKQKEKFCKNCCHIDFSKGAVRAEFAYNEHNELYSVNMIKTYSEQGFSDALDFFFYMNSILKEKYLKSKNPNALEGYFNFKNLSVKNQYEHFVKGDFYMVCEYETKTTKITVCLFPWTPHDGDIRTVFNLEYRAKNIPAMFLKKNNYRGIDSQGL